MLTGELFEDDRMVEHDASIRICRGSVGDG
jgi:hypothetical protein